MLILICVVALILAAMFQFNDAIKVWANNYFGDYLTCLLETGELPSIGGAPGDSGVCNQYFKPFSLKDGRPFKTSTPNDPKNSQASNNSSARGNREASAGGKYRGGSGGGGGGGGSGGQFGSSPNVNSETPPQAASKPAGLVSKADQTSNYGSVTSRGFTTGPGGTLSRGFYVTRDRIEDKPAGYSAGKDLREGYFKSPRKFHLKPIRKPAAVPPEEPFTLGNFLRLLIIAAIIIALLVLFGGQSLQINRNME